MPAVMARRMNSGNSTALSVVEKNFSTRSQHGPLTWMSNRLSWRSKASSPASGVSAYDAEGSADSSTSEKFLPVM